MINNNNNNKSHRSFDTKESPSCQLFVPRGPSWLYIHNYLLTHHHRWLDSQLFSIWRLRSMHKIKKHLFLTLYVCVPLLAPSVHYIQNPPLETRIAASKVFADSLPSLPRGSTNYIGPLPFKHRFCIERSPHQTKFARVLVSTTATYHRPSVYEEPSYPAVPNVWEILN